MQIHSCHNPLREVEVLHDFLLECFEEVPELTSRDVLVLAAAEEEVVAERKRSGKVSAWERDLRPVSLEDWLG